MDELTREHVLKMISKRIVEAVILSHHLSEYDLPQSNYVVVKTLYEWPSLDKSNTNTFDEIRKILREAFGIVINENPYHFMTGDVQ